MFKTFSTMTLLGLLTFSAAQAQTGQPVRAKVPFAFAVRNTMLQPGSYELSYSRTSHILSLQGLGQNSAKVFISAQPVSGMREGQGQAKLEFGCYAESCFLTRVWQGAQLDGQGLMLATGIRERGLAFSTRAVSITIPGK